MEKPDLVAIDGDLLAFIASSANEQRRVIAKHKETLEEHDFKTATLFKEWAGDTVDEYELTPTQKAGPMENAFHIVNHMIGNITKACGVSSYHIVVSGDTNFRLDLPLPTKYKGNREGGVKPIQLKDCKKYLLHSHSAEVSVDKEADDVLVAYAANGSAIQATIDKDGDSTEGWLYNWEKMTEPQFVSGFGNLNMNVKESASGTKTKKVDGKGRIWLYYQMVFGDAADCYKPCELAKAKFGEVGAYELLKNCTTDKEALEAIMRQYKAWYPEPITYRAWDGSLQENKSWMDIWQLYADAAFMQRWDGDRFDVKKVLTKQGIIDG